MKPKEFVRDDQCPHCGYKTDCATHPEKPNVRPRIGDLSMCINCGGLNAFGDDLILRKATPNEAREVADEIARYRAALGEVKGISAHATISAMLFWAFAMTTGMLIVFHYLRELAL